MYHPKLVQAIIAGRKDLCVGSDYTWIQTHQSFHESAYYGRCTSFEEWIPTVDEFIKCWSSLDYRGVWGFHK